MSKGARTCPVCGKSGLLNRKALTKHIRNEHGKAGLTAAKERGTTHE